MAIEQKKVTEIAENWATILANLNTKQDAMVTDTGSGDVINELTIGSMITKYGDKLQIPAIQFTYDSLTTSKIYQSVKFDTVTTGDTGADVSILNDTGLQVDRVGLDESAKYESDNILISKTSGDETFQAQPEFMAITDSTGVNSDIIDIRLSNMAITFTSDATSGEVRKSATTGGIECTNDPSHNTNQTLVNRLILSDELSSLASITFDGTVPSETDKTIFWDNTNGCPAYYNSVSGIVNQLGQELWKPVRNVTGSIIPDGSIVYINGEDAGFPTVALAKSDSLTTASGTIGFATHDIPTDIGGSGVNGYITISGTVRGLNTAACSAGTTMYLSDTVAGAYTDIAPSSPSYVIRLGVCGIQDAVNGTIEAEINIGDNRQIFPNFFNGALIGDRDVRITSDGVTVKATLEAQGGGDLNSVFDGNFTLFDSTPKAEVALTAGTDANPTRNYAYILKSTNLLTASTTGWPAAEHVPVLDAYIGSAATVQTKGPSKHQEWTEHVQDPDGMGHLFHINRWVRQQPATYVSGLTPSFSGSGTGTIGLSNTEGVGLQFHDHTFPAIVDPAPVRVINDTVTPNVEITNLADIDTDANGVTLNNSTFAVVLWAVINEYEADCKWYATLPGGSYAAGKPADARNDAQGYTDYSIPSVYTSNSILVHRLIMSRNAGGTVVTLYPGDTSDDLRGKMPNTTVGSGGGGTPGLSSVLGVDPSAGNIVITDLGNATADAHALNRITADGRYVNKVTSTDNAITRFDGTSGEVQDSAFTISDAGDMDAGGGDIVNVAQIATSTSTPDAGTSIHTKSSSAFPVWKLESTTSSGGLLELKSSEGYTQLLQLGGEFRINIDSGALLGFLLSGNGIQTLPQSTTANIDAAGDKAVIIKEWVNASVPATASSTGVAGTFAYDSSYFYICTATNTWKRVAIATW